MYHVLLDKINSAYLPNKVFNLSNSNNQLIVKHHKSFVSFPISLSIRVLDINGNIVTLPFTSFDDCHDIVNYNIKIVKILIDPVYLEKKEDAFKNCTRVNDFYFFIDYDTIKVKREDKFLYSFSFIMPSILFFDKRNNLYQEAFKQDMFVDKITEMLSNIQGEVIEFSDYQTKDNKYIILFSVKIPILQKMKNKEV